MGHGISCFVCTRKDLIAGDVARVLDLPMGVLKHSLHSCFFCYHRRTTALEEEVAFFNGRLGASRILVELLSLRRQYRPSFAFVLRCLPTLARLHLRTARDNRFPRAA